MCRILLSINPQHVENIVHGKKCYEYRKRTCKRKVDKIIIYSTCPVKQVIGEVEVLDTLEMDKDELWKLTKDQSGITRKFYNAYFKGKKTAVAYKLGSVLKYDSPQSLKDIGIKVAPQSFLYLPDTDNVCM